VRRTEGKRPLGRPRPRRKNIKMDFQKVGWGISWIDLDQDKDGWGAFVNVARKHRVP